jgi:hypothetical protein
MEAWGMMMRGVQVEVPDVAKARLDALGIARDEALDSSRAAQSRMNMLPLDAVEMQAKLTAERDKHAHRHNHIHRLLSSCNEYLFRLRLPPGQVLEPAPPPDIKINRSLSAAIAYTREQIAEVQREIARTRALPMKRASQQEAINRYLASQALRVEPRVSFDQRGNARFLWNEDLIHSKDDLLGILYWIAPSSVSKAFAESLPQDDPEGAVSPDERDAAVKKFTNTLTALEYQEEHLIERAAADGMEVLRRPDASPLAVLGVVIAAAKESQAAA